MDPRSIALTTSVTGMVERFTSRKIGESDLTEGLLNGISIYIRSYFLGEALHRLVARSAFSLGARIKRGPGVLSAGAEFESALGELFNECLTAAGFTEQAADHGTTLTNRLTKSLTRLFVKSQARPAAQRVLHRRVQALVMQVCSGMANATTLGERVRDEAIEHVWDCFTVNQTVFDEIERTARRHALVLRENDGASIGEGPEFVARLRKFLDGLLRQVLPPRPTTPGRK